MRYFLELAYNGTSFNGYQIQPNAKTVQESIEKALTTFLRKPTSIVGCGRTDAGVHALHYYAHFDTDQELTNYQLLGLNALVGPNIALYNLVKVKDDAHARFDATSRSYQYVVSTRKNPFTQETAYHCPFAERIDQERMQQAARLLLDFTEFETFCKTKTDAKTRRCDLRRSEWVFDDENHRWVYHVTADRFLRGMIRLIVGMCLNVGRGKLQLETVREALEQQNHLKLSWSAPPQGLFLMDIRYAYLD